MRASRLLSILILLQLRARLTAEQLAREFEVSIRTIYRDIDALSAAGVPVYGDRGPGGGFALLDGYKTRLTGLDASEAEAMLMIGMPGQAAALGLGAAAGRARGKLLAALTPEGSAVADRIAGRFHLDPADWYRAAEPVTWLPSIARAVIDQQRLSLRYESWKGVRNRLVDPMGLVQKGASWYLVGRIDGDYRTYRVGAIKSLTVKAERFDRPSGFDLAGYWATQLKRFEEGLRPETARLWVSTEGRRRLAELGAYAAKAVADARAPDANGWAELDLPFENLEQGARLVLGIGPEIVVIAPAALRAAVREVAAAAIERQDGLA
ncbi:MAG: WYL domain-containing protein [Sphingomonadaceae bacterium]|nr:WYL domain-containing protein [Sphingomonadaceae bacterium]